MKPTSKRSKASDGDIALPASFKPSATSVVVGKSKLSKHAQGNALLKTICREHLEDYAKAGTNKTAKSIIVSKIVDHIQSKCTVGAFIKRSQEGVWYEVSKSVAREKVSHNVCH